MVDFPQPARIVVNGIRLAVHDLGDGPAIVLLHGFPELGYSWRHQFAPLASAGYRVIAPDQRGYGDSDAPSAVSDYALDKLIGDVWGLLDALALDKAVFVGHDWGALLIWNMALIDASRMRGIVNLNIPFYAATPIDPISIMRKKFGEDFYIVNFQDSGEADRAFAADVEHFFRMMMRRNQIDRRSFDALPQAKKTLSLLATMARDVARGEQLLTDTERSVYVRAFEKSGFTGPINWYRNWSRNWARIKDLPQQIDVPTLFIGAEDDVIVAPEHIEAMRDNVSDLELHMISECGHWTQQERPKTVNRLMLDWLARRFPP